MRLTLRTLLAYMDGILDPKDHADLEKQVETSDVAADLIHRTRDTTRRLRLAAPPLHEDPSGFDANAVAEYLDNVANPDAVAAFERHCLESDGHLAEAASCHHILTMVLGERADVDAETRRRMYAIPEVAEALARQEQAGSTALTTSVTPTVHRSDAEVPDYLREPAGATILRWAPAVAALLLLGFVSYMAFRTDGWLQPPRDVVANDGPVTEDPVDGGSKTNGAEPDNTADSEDGGLQGGVDQTANGTDGEALPGDGGEVGGLEGGSADGGLVGSDKSTDDSDDPAGAAGSGSAEPSANMPSLGDDNGAGLPELDLSPATSGMNPRVGDVTNNVPALPTTAGDLGDGGPDDSDDTPADAGDALAAPVTLGNLSSTGQVLLRYNEADSSWRRLLPDTAVYSTDRLLSLPTYRPTIALDARLKLELVGGTQVEFDADSATEAPTVKPTYGRVVLSNPSGEPTAVRLEIGDLIGEVTIDGLRSLAIEAARPFVPGADPTQTLAPMQAALFAPEGGVAWSGPAGEFVIAAGEGVRIDGVAIGPAARASLESVAWVGGENLSSWDELATDAVEDKLRPGEPIWPLLMELANASAKEKEKQALIIVSSAFVGHFDPFIRALAEPDQRPAWNREIRTMRLVMSRSKELASAVRDAFIARHEVDRGGDLYTMLCGFSPEQVGDGADQLKTGALRQLLDWMASPNLEYRVLANYNFEQITGKERVFNPTASERLRSSTLSKWNTRLEEGKLDVSPKP